MEEVEDAIAHQLAVVGELERQRLRVTDPERKAQLRRLECNARAVLDWLRDLRGEMYGPPPPR